jgi:hypothetical protein
MTHYEMQGYGDLADPEYNGGYKKGLHNPLPFPSLTEAVWYLEKWANYTETDNEDGEPVNVGLHSLLDPEDDKVEIHEVNGKKRKLVWIMFGWHYDMWHCGVEQGKFIGHAKSVYEEIMEDY